MRLPPVMMAPFFVIGMLAAYYGSAIVRLFVILAFGTLGIVLGLKRKRALLCAIGGFFGAVIMLLWLCLSVYPAQSYVGKTLKTDLFVTEIISSNGGYQKFAALAYLDGRTVRVTIGGVCEASEGDNMTALVEFSAIDEEYKVSSFAKGVMLTGKVKKVYSIFEEYSMHKTLSQIRRSAKALLSKGLSNDEEALALAVLLGDTSRLSLLQLESMRISGVSHYSAVSGTHFSVFTAAILLIIANKSKRIRLFSIIACVPLAAAFFGGSMSVIRSAVMITICFASELFGRKTVVLNSLCAAVIIICAISPGAILDLGFQLSVLGVFGAGFVGNEIYEIIEEKIPLGMQKLLPLIKALTTSSCAVICTSPLCVKCFGGVSMLGAFTTIIISPLFTFAAAIGLVYFITGAGFLAGALGWFLKTMMSIIYFFGKMRLGWTDINFTGAYGLTIVCVLLLVEVALFHESNKKISLKHFVCLCALTLFINCMARQARSQVEFISDGTSGAAISIKQDEAEILISGKGSEGLVADIAERLDRNGVRVINAICGTQVSSAVVSSLAELSNIIPVVGVYVSNTTYQTDFAENVYVSEYAKGDIKLGGWNISSAKSGSAKSGDIVLYYGFKRSVPVTNADIAIYASSQQQMLPDNGINIYGMVYTIKIE